MNQVSKILTGYEDRLYYPRDINDFGNRYGLSTRQLADIFRFQGKLKTKTLRETEGDQKPLSPTIQMLLRMYLRHPETIPLAKKLSAQEFFDNVLGGQNAVATRFRGVLFGVDRNSAYNWNRDSEPNAQVLALMVAAKRLKEVRNLSNEQLLQTLIDNFNVTTEVLRVNPLKDGSWSRRNSAEKPLTFALSDVSEKAVQLRGRRVKAKSNSGLKLIDKVHLLSVRRGIELNT